VTAIPQIIAHRGAPREALENTIPAFQAAMAQRADAIELDVHATRDGIVIVHHDDHLPPDRNEPFASGRSIADLDADEVLRRPLPGGFHIPTLDDVLDLVGSQLVVYVEVKAVGIEGPLLACLDRHPAVRTAVHAFDHRIPVAVRVARPSLPIGLLSSSYPLDLPGFIGPGRPEALWQHGGLIDDALVRDAHAMGARVIAWTVNDPDHARSLWAMGVDGICTDLPGAMRRSLEG